MTHHSRSAFRTVAPVIAVLAALSLAGCSSGPTQPDGTPDPAPAATEPSTPAGDDRDDKTPPTWLETAAEQFAKSQDPQPSIDVTGDTAVEFRFSAGSVNGTDARSDCLIATMSIGEEYELTMTYPDGSVLCSDIVD